MEAAYQATKVFIWLWEPVWKRRGSVPEQICGDEIWA